MSNVTRIDICKMYGFPTGFKTQSVFLGKMCDKKNKWYSAQEVMETIVRELNLSGLDEETPHGKVFEVFLNAVSTGLAGGFEGAKVTRHAGFERAKKKMTNSKGRNWSIWHYRRVEATQVVEAPAPKFAAPTAGTDVVSLLTRIATAQERIAAALEYRSLVSP